MVQKFRIGIFGALVNNSNLGCCALTYGLLSMLNNISSKINCDFTYIIFERNVNKYKIEKLSEELNIEVDNIIGIELGKFLRVYKFIDNQNCKNEISKCDFCISLTQGDSFADIYGVKHFLLCWIDQYVVVKKKIPLIMGPQTYGPYNNIFCRKLAKFIIKRAVAIFTRDSYSTEYLRSIGIGKQIYTATDIAFGLPFKKMNFISDKFNIGINISGLLWPEKIEATPIHFELKCNYMELMKETIYHLLDKGYSVHLISHVGADYEVAKKVAVDFPSIILVDKFSNPVEAKSYIAAMDLFIGARMHATIGAFSSGVPVIPVSYSRKFIGLFNDLMYSPHIDLLKMDTGSAIRQMNKYLINIDALKAEIDSSRDLLDNKYGQMVSDIENEITKVISHIKY